MGGAYFVFSRPEPHPVHFSFQILYFLVPKFPLDFLKNSFYFSAEKCFSSVYFKCVYCYDMDLS